ncbi:MAG: tetratricopeptide repeat protein [Magnetococcales bacterium]|nr:tetratricopeptide repeat protein [Magnetococcales bacterium]
MMVSHPRPLRHKKTSHFVGIGVAFLLSLGACVWTPPVADSVAAGEPEGGVPQEERQGDGMEFDGSEGVLPSDGADELQSVDPMGGLAVEVTEEGGSVEDVDPFANLDENTDTVFFYMLGQLYLRENKWQLAEKAFIRVAESDPESVEANLIVAHLATQRGDLDQAVRYTTEVVKRAPDHRKARFLLAGLLTARKEYDKAVTHYEILLKGEPEHHAARLLLAQLYGRLKKIDKAQVVLAPLFTDKELGWKAHLALGRAYVSVPDIEQALKSFQAARAADPDEIEPVLAVGAALQEMKRPEEAEKLYREYLETHPDNKAIHGRLGRLLLKRNDRVGALEEFRAITKLAPDSLQARLTTGLLLVSEKKYEEAVVELRLVEATQPENSTVLYYLGQALEATNRDDEAQTTYEKIKKGDPFFAEAQLRLAFLNVSKGNLEAGINKIQQLLNEDKKNTDLYGALSILQLQANQFEAVIATCTEGLALDAGHDRLLFNRAMALDKLKRWPEAERDLKVYVERNPDDAHGLNYLGYSWADRGEHLEEAYQLIQKASQLAPGDGFISDSLGWVLYRLNRLEEALVRMREAVRLEADDPVIREHLGDILFAMGKKDEALEVWKKALSLDASNEELQKKINRNEAKK